MKTKFKFTIITSLFSIFLFGAVHAADFGGIGGKPAHPTGEHLHDKEWFFFTLNPGESKEDAIQIQNNDDTANTIIFYPADSTPSTDGGFALKQKVESQDAVGKWIQFSQNQITLPPHQSTIIPFTITIPKDEKIDVGEHTGAILLQKSNEEPTTAGGMQLFTRVGVRVYVTIPGEIIKKLEITKFFVEPNKEKSLYTAALSIKNSGNTSQDVVVKTKIINLYPWLNNIPFIKNYFQAFPIENERSFQVLRDDSLTSNFEFKKPLFGKFRVESSIIYNDKTQILAARPIELKIGLDMNMIILLVLICAFIVCVFAFSVLRGQRAEQKIPVKISSKKKVKVANVSKKTSSKNKKTIPKKIKKY